MTSNREFTLDISYPVPTEMAVPDFDKILRMCLKELVDKYPHYKNTWLQNSHQLVDGKSMPNAEYFNYRLKRETEELESALTPKEAQRKLVNIINLATLRLHRLVNG